MTDDISLDGAGPVTEYLSPNATPKGLAATAQDNAKIAPWLASLDEPPTHPPKASQSSKSFGRKRSIHNITYRREGSNSTLSFRKGTSDANSITDSISSYYSEKTFVPELHKSKSSLFSIPNIPNMIKKKASKVGRDDASLTPSEPIPVPELPSSFYRSIPPASPFIGTKRKNRMRDDPPPPLPPKEPEFRLDTNFEEMDGIVNLSMVVPDNRPSGPESNSPGTGSGFESSCQSSGLSTSDHGFQQMGTSPPQLSRVPSSPAVFSNPDPFLSNGSFRRRVGSHNAEQRKVSPKTIISPVMQHQWPAPNDPHNPSWSAPESWAVEKEGEVPDVPEYSSSEDDDAARMSIRLMSTQQSHPQRRKTRTAKRAPFIPSDHYQARIHRPDNTYHVVKCTLTTTVADLIPVLNKKLLLDANTRETHSLYVKERERERVLAPTERPMNIVRRRLEQAGYDVADGLQTLGAEEIGFLVKFIYKSNVLGGDGDEDPLTNSNFEYINLTGKSLKTISPALHRHAESIVSLNLSRNPMIEIPLDFIQSCTSLRELRLSNMAIKKVPQSVRHSVPLSRLDISCNRIADLSDAGLDRIPNLKTLKAQNNRMDNFPRLHSVHYLNISNNKFQQFPPVLTEMTNLVDLDISFNNISSLPPEIGLLHNLEILIIVGNQINRFPPECAQLIKLVTLDCRRNHLADLSLVSRLPKLQQLFADHNNLHALDLTVGQNMTKLDVSHNDITKLTVTFGPAEQMSYQLTTLNLSNAKLSSLDESAFLRLTTLEILNLDHNLFRVIPDTLGSLTRLTYLSASNNQLIRLPASIGLLQNLETLDVHNNSLTELPASMWQCGKLNCINVTSNLLTNWHDPPASMLVEQLPSTTIEQSAFGEYVFVPERKASTAGSIMSSASLILTPLSQSLQRLYLGENRMTDEVLLPFTLMRELKVLNLSFNEIQELPPFFFKNLLNLEEIYLSGNKLSSLPTEDLPRLSKLNVLFLNGNKFQVLPQELGKITSLTVLDVGSNSLKYNINNWEFDWNWNFNQNLKYLNLSGNKRLKIQPDNQRVSSEQQHLQGHEQRKLLSDFQGLRELRFLGLMDVTTTSAKTIPEETDERRVRTSPSEVNRMAYGIADTLGKKDHLTMLDLVIPEFREQKDEAIFAMFGRFGAASASTNRFSKFLADSFSRAFADALDKIDTDAGETVGDALRRAFLTLNKRMHQHFATLLHRKSSAASTTPTVANYPNNQLDPSIFRNGATGIVVYFDGKTIYVANAGDALAVISRQGTARLVSAKHEPFDRAETARIRGAEGWVSPNGLVNEEIEMSRGFGFYHLLPVVNPRPEITKWDLTELDEFLIIANRGLWDYISYQTAIDIARSEKDDPMIAAQKLRDFTVSYGADGGTMIMVISVAALFEERLSRARLPTAGSLVEGDAYMARRRPKIPDVGDMNLFRLPLEVAPPTGHIALAFTDIRNSTHLWEVNPGMATAIRVHNTLLRRQLRLCGGYEVKTEGDAFMCSFPNSLSAFQWCLTVQQQLLHESWPLEILECDDGKPIYDENGNLLARGLSVRMGIHCGTPVACEPDPITYRMDYFGPMVNRAARIQGSAAGGQIMCSADVIREIKARLDGDDEEYEYDPTLTGTIDSIRNIGYEIIPVGHKKMKGLERPEMVSAVYPRALRGRYYLKESAPGTDASGSKVQFSVQQMRELAMLCVRLEMLTSSRVLRPVAQQRGTAPSTAEEEVTQTVYVYADPEVLIPSISDKASDRELMTLLDNLSLRIDNALTTLTLRRIPGLYDTLLSLFRPGAAPSGHALEHVLMQLQPT